MEKDSKKEPESWIKITLKNQVELISERSKDNQTTSAELLDLTNAMIAILEYVVHC